MVVGHIDRRLPEAQRMDQFHKRTTILRNTTVYLDDLTTIHTKLRHGLVGSETTEEVVSLMEHCRRHPFQERVLTNNPAGTHDIVAFPCLTVHRREVFGFILQITIDDGDIVALGIRQSCRDGVWLTEVTTQVDALHTLVLLTDSLDTFP